MKHLFRVACLAATFVGLSCPGRADSLQTSVPHAILIDAGTGTVLFEKDADELVVPFLATF